MKAERPLFVLVVILCVGLFLFSTTIFLSFAEEYNEPLGNIDAKNYYTMFLEEARYHVLLPFTIIFLNRISGASILSLMSIGIPFSIFILLPFSFFLFSYNYSKSLGVSSLAVIFLIFGTDSLIVNLFVGIWAQTVFTALLFLTLLAMMMYLKNRKGIFLGLSVSLTALSCLSHECFSMLSIVVFCAFLFLIGKPKWILVSFVIWIVWLLVIPPQTYHCINAVKKPPLLIPKNPTILPSSIVKKNLEAELPFLQGFMFMINPVLVIYALGHGAFWKRKTKERILLGVVILFLFLSIPVHHKMRSLRILAPFVCLFASVELLKEKSTFVWLYMMFYMYLSFVFIFNNSLLGLFSFNNIPLP